MSDEASTLRVQQEEIYHCIRLLETMLVTDVPTPRKVGVPPKADRIRMPMVFLKRLNKALRAEELAILTAGSPSDD